MQQKLKLPSVRQAQAIRNSRSITGDLAIGQGALQHPALEDVRLFSEKRRRAYDYQQ